MVIAPLAYRPRAGAKLLYRQPAYLIVSHPDLTLAHVVQHYVRRLDFEAKAQIQTNKNPYFPLMLCS